MTVSADTLRLLMEAGLSGDDLLRVVESIEASSGPKTRSANAERQARHRAKLKAASVTNNVTSNVTKSVTDVTPLARVEDNLQTKNSTGQEGKKEKDAPEARSFPEFWSLYPNKVGKRDAEAAFLKALKRADLETIVAGLRRYAAKTDDRPWCNPATWLNQDRWEDRPATVAPAPRQTAPPRQTVGQQAREELRRMMNDAPDHETRHFLESDGSADFAGSGLARRFALSTGGRGGH